MILHPLFHWSPADRRTRIQRRGLLLNARPVAHTFRMGYVCTSSSPSLAWSLSARVFGERGQEWDCWQVSLDPTDEVHVREFFGNRIEEIRIYNSVPKSRLWLVGSRTVPVRGRRF